MKNLFFLTFFFILAGNISLYSQQIITSTQEEFKEGDHIFRIEVSRAAYTDEAVVAFFSGASDAYDIFDSEKMFSPDANYPQTYTLSTDNHILAINGESSIVSSFGERYIPLGFKSTFAGENSYTFTATNLASFDAAVSVYIEDLDNAIIQNLRTDNTFDFTSFPANNATRFRLHFIANVWTGSTSSDWNVASNWSSGAVPTATDDVYITSVPGNQPQITNAFSSPSSCDDLVIYSGASLTINSTKALSIEGSFVNDGTFTIKSDASGTGSFIDNGSISGTGTFSVEKYLPENAWWYIGSPMNNATAGSFGALSGSPNTGTRLFSWDEPTGLYSNITAAPTALSPLQGYVYKNFNTAGGPLTALFSGTLNSGTLGSSDNLSKDGAGAYAGFNLVCNPYPSPIDIEVFGPTCTNIQNTVWFHSGNNYPLYNWLTNLGTLGGQRYIPAMQGFWVKVSTDPGTLIIDNSSRVHDDQAFYKTTAQANVFRLEVNRDALMDEAVVAFFPAAVDTYDAYDSEKMFSSDQDIPQVYTLTSDNVVVAINGESEITSGEVRIIPVGFVTYVAGTFTFTATTMDEFDPTIPVSLEDIELGTFQDFDALNTTYTFTSGVISNATRFNLHFGSSTTGINSELSESAYSYSADNIIYVHTPDHGYSIELFDLTGNKILKQNSDEGLNKIQTSISNGIYILKIYNETQTLTQKIFIN